MKVLINEEVQLKFDDKGLIPAVAQDYRTGQILMVAYMNREAIEKTLETGKVHYWSRSRQKLWLKGETSGHFQYVKDILVDCDKDTLVIKVEQVGPACHTGHHSCFYTTFPEGEAVGDDEKSTDAEEAGSAGILRELYEVIVDRKKNPREGSYTNYLFDSGIDKILKKLAEENAEVIIAAKNPSNDEVIYETADLIYHLLVMLVERGISLEEIFKELKDRR